MHKQKECDKDNMIKILLNKSTTWITTSNNDTNAIIALLHANYATGYLRAMSDIFTEEEITNASGINLSEFRNKIIKEQNIITNHVMKLCYPKKPPNKN